jgi:hypothetical protein
MSFEAMKFGPLGEAVDAAMPSSEADPVGVWAACLSLYSSAISRKVRLDNGRPVVIWTVLAGRSAIGRKGYALNTAKGILRPVIGGYMEARVRDGISSGPSLVDMLAKLELETMGSELGVDGRALLVEEEWASVLKTQKRCNKFSTLFRTAWDGKPISNRTKKEGLQTVLKPLLGFHSHITPGEWAKYVSSSDALGGSYNRLLPVLVERSKMLPYDHKPSFGDPKALTATFKWAVEEERVMSFDRAAGQRFDELRATIEDRMAEMPELLSSYMERAAEQVQRIAAVLTATEKKTKISRKAVEAAWEFVQYSMASVEKLVREAADQAAKPMKTTEELIREVLARYGGEASSTTLLRALGTRANAAAIREAVAGMDDVEVYKLQQPGRGAKPIMYRLLTTAEDMENIKNNKPDEEHKAHSGGKPRLMVVEGQDSRPRRGKKRVKPDLAAQPAVNANPILALL